MDRALPPRPGSQGDAGASIRALLSDGAARSVREICGALTLPRSTVVNALDRLAEAEVVAELGPAAAGRGRPSRRWTIAASPGPLAVLIGAAHGTTAGIVTAAGEVRARVTSHAAAHAPTTRAAALSLLDQAVHDAGVVGADLQLAILGLPGPSAFPSGPDHDAQIGFHLRRFREWDGQVATEAVADALGCPVFAENDANLAALGETHRGVGRGAENLLFVSLAYGTGAGLVLDGRLHRGRTRLAGEIGHLHHDDHGRLCDCGARGCFWHSTSVPALLTELASAHGRDFAVGDLADAAAAGELDVVRALLGFGHALGRRLADAVVFIDPDVIVLDGALGEASSIVAEGVRETVRRYAPPSMTHGLRIEAGILGPDAPLVGAAMLASTEGLLAHTRPAAATS